MNNYYQHKIAWAIRSLLLLVLIGWLPTSCEDDYTYDTEEPDFMNGSIYEYLQSDGHYTYFVRLIEELGYKEVLNLTGSKTLFVAGDDAFATFFNSNEWGVSNYEELSTNQKKQLFYFAMINNAYTIEKLSNYYDGDFHEGMAMRRLTALSTLDNVSIDHNLPRGSYWDMYRQKGLYLLKDNSDMPLSFFSQQFIDKSGMTDSDFSFLSGGIDRVKNDFFVFNKKVVQRDIVCKNGYINILDQVLTPPVNMAEYIASNSKTSVFSQMLDRFCAPYYDAPNTALYRELNPGFTDSIFNKQYFSSQGGALLDPKGNPVSLLPFNPGWNAYAISSSNTTQSTIYPDMAAMFVPTDEAMADYFNNDPTGMLLKERYGSWSGLPNDVAVSFLTRHMRTSLMESLPSKFSKMVDDQNYPLKVVESDILQEHNYTAVNGEVFVTNKVYTPVDFISVYGPVLLNENAKIMNWAINRTETAIDGTLFAFYKLYLNSLVVNYGLFIPSDNYFDRCIDPVAYGQTGLQGALKYWYNERTASVNATLYTYSKATDQVGDSVGVITAGAFIQNRLWKILDSHIVIGDISKDGYYVTKANDIIKVSDEGSSIQGGFDIEKNTRSTVTRKFNQENGTTYMLDHPIQPSLRSTYSTLGDLQKSEFSLFFELLNDIPSDFASEIPPIFTPRGLDYCISFFNAYHYTIYAPSNEAINTAIREGVIKTWDEINRLPQEQRKKETQNMVRFLRYHFQDQTVFVGQVENNVYESNTLRLPEDQFPSHWGTTPNKHYKLGVQEENGTIKLTTESKGEARVILRDGYYNLIAKDYVFNSNTSVSSSFKNVDGTGATSAQPFGNSLITTSSSVVIHLIDKVLTFK